MAVCYGCLLPFDEVLAPCPGISSSTDVADEELFIEEPTERGLGRPPAVGPFRFHVTVAGLFGYDIYLSRMEGAQLTIGCARDNNIVLPHTESRRHLLRLYYAQAQVWVQDRGSTQQACVEGMPLTGTCCLKQGAVLEVGEAKIELVEE
jgi:hypothetical protein